jgi:ABC-type branched-subunit amino acid transport system substrate-binding protein
MNAPPQPNDPSQPDHDSLDLNSPQTRREMLRRAGTAAAGMTLLGNVLAACGSSSQSAPATRASTVAGESGSKDAIKVGVLYSLSGDLSIAEVPMSNSTMMAIDELNAAGGIGGRMIEPIVEDYASDFGVVVQKARKLVGDDKVSAVIGCYSSASRKAVLPVFEQGENVLLYPTFYEGLECSTNVIYTSLVANQHLTDATEWMVKNIGKRIYMVGSNYVGPQTYNAIVTKLAQAQGANVIANRFFPLEQTDFGSVLSAIGEAKPDVIWCTIVGAGLPAFYKQYHAAGYTPEKMPIFSGICTEQELGAMGGAIAKGHYFPASYFEKMSSADNRSFIKRYQSKYGSQEPTNMPMQASYNSAYLLAAAIEKAGEATPQAILKAFPGVSHKPPGLEGVVTVQANHHTTHQVFLGRANGEALYDVIAKFPERQPEPFPKAIVPAAKIPSCPRRESA